MFFFLQFILDLVVLKETLKSGKKNIFRQKIAV